MSGTNKILTRWKVTYQDYDGETFIYYFMAENKEHAIEQLLNAEPNTCLYTAVEAPKP